VTGVQTCALPIYHLIVNRQPLSLKNPKWLIDKHL